MTANPISPIRRPGRQIAAETWPERVESSMFDLNHLGRVGYGSCRDERLAWDREHDFWINVAVEYLAAGNTTGARRALRKAQVADAHEDAAAERGDGVVTQILAVCRRVCTWIEALTTGRCRQSPRRAVARRAEQMVLMLEVDG